MGASGKALGRGCGCCGGAPAAAHRRPAVTIWDRFRRHTVNSGREMARLAWLLGGLVLFVRAFTEDLGVPTSVRVVCSWAMVVLLLVGAVADLLPCVGTRAHMAVFLLLMAVGAAYFVADPIVAAFVAGFDVNEPPDTIPIFAANEVAAFIFGCLLVPIIVHDVKFTGLTQVLTSAIFVGAVALRAAVGDAGWRDLPSEAGVLPAFRAVVLVRVIHVIYLSTAREHKNMWTLFVQRTRSRLSAISAEERLTLSMPRPVAHSFMDRTREVKEHSDVTVVFFYVTNMRSLVRSTATHGLTTELIRSLHRLYQRLDTLVLAHRFVYKIESVDDCYMVASGVPNPCVCSAHHALTFAITVLFMLHEFRKEYRVPWEVKIGIHTGPVAAGIIGTSRTFYRLFGDTMNTASRMGTRSAPGRILLSDATFTALGRPAIINPNEHPDFAPPLIHGALPDGKGTVEALLHPRHGELRPVHCMLQGADGRMNVERVGEDVLRRFALLRNSSTSRAAFFILADVGWVYMKGKGYVRTYVADVPAEVRPDSFILNASESRSTSTAAGAHSVGTRSGHSLGPTTTARGTSPSMRFPALSLEQERDSAVFARSASHEEKRAFFPSPLPDATHVDVDDSTGELSDATSARGTGGGADVGARASVRTGAGVTDGARSTAGARSGRGSESGRSPLSSLSSSSQSGVLSSVALAPVHLSAPPASAYGSPDLPGLGLPTILEENPRRRSSMPPVRPPARATSPPTAKPTTTTAGGANASPVPPSVVSSSSASSASGPGMTMVWRVPDGTSPMATPASIASGVSGVSGASGASGAPAARPQSHSFSRGKPTMPDSTRRREDASVTFGFQRSRSGADADTDDVGAADDRGGSDDTSDSEPRGWEGPESSPAAATTATTTTTAAAFRTAPSNVPTSGAPLSSSTPRSARKRVSGSATGSASSGTPTARAVSPADSPVASAGSPRDPMRSVANASGWGRIEHSVSSGGTAPSPVKASQSTPQGRQRRIESADRLPLDAIAAQVTDEEEPLDTTTVKRRISLPHAHPLDDANTAPFTPGRTERDKDKDKDGGVRGKGSPGSAGVGAGVGAGVSNEVSDELLSVLRNHQTMRMDAGYSGFSMSMHPLTPFGRGRSRMSQQGSVSPAAGRPRRATDAPPPSPTSLVHHRTPSAEAGSPHQRGTPPRTQFTPPAAVSAEFSGGLGNPVLSPALIARSGSNSPGEQGIDSPSSGGPFANGMLALTRLASVNEDGRLNVPVPGDIPALPGDGEMEGRDDGEEGEGGVLGDEDGDGERTAGSATGSSFGAAAGDAHGAETTTDTAATQDSLRNGWGGFSPSKLRRRMNESAAPTPTEVEADAGEEELHPDMPMHQLRRLLARAMRRKQTSGTAAFQYAQILDIIVGQLLRVPEHEALVSYKSMSDPTEHVKEQFTSKLEKNIVRVEMIGRRQRRRSEAGGHGRRSEDEESWLGWLRRCCSERDDRVRPSSSSYGADIQSRGSRRGGALGIRDGNSSGFFLGREGSDDLAGELRSRRSSAVGEGDALQGIATNQRRPARLTSQNDEEEDDDESEDDSENTLFDEDDDYDDHVHANPAPASDDDTRHGTPPRGSPPEMQVRSATSRSPATSHTSSSHLVPRSGSKTELVKHAGELSFRHTHPIPVAGVMAAHEHLGSAAPGGGSGLGARAGSHREAPTAVAVTVTPSIQSRKSGSDLAAAASGPSAFAAPRSSDASVDRASRGADVGPPGGAAAAAGSLLAGASGRPGGLSSGALADSLGIGHASAPPSHGSSRTTNSSSATSGAGTMTNSSAFHGLAGIGAGEGVGVGHLPRVLDDEEDDDGLARPNATTSARTRGAPDAAGASRGARRDPPAPTAAAASAARVHGGGVTDLTSVSERAIPATAGSGRSVTEGGGRTAGLVQGSGVGAAGGARRYRHREPGHRVVPAVAANDLTAVVSEDDAVANPSSSAQPALPGSANPDHNGSFVTLVGFETAKKQRDRHLKAEVLAWGHTFLGSMFGSTHGSDADSSGTNARPSSSPSTASPSPSPMRVHRTRPDRTPTHPPRGPSTAWPNHTSPDTRASPFVGGTHERHDGDAADASHGRSVEGAGAGAAPTSSTPIVRLVPFASPATAPQPAVGGSGTDTSSGGARTATGPAVGSLLVRTPSANEGVLRGHPVLRPTANPPIVPASASATSAATAATAAPTGSHNPIVRAGGVLHSSGHQETPSALVTGTVGETSFGTPRTSAPDPMRQTSASSAGTAAAHGAGAGAVGAAGDGSATRPAPRRCVRVRACHRRLHRQVRKSWRCVRNPSLWPRAYYLGFYHADLESRFRKERSDVLYSLYNTHGVYAVVFNIVLLGFAAGTEGLQNELLAWTSIVTTILMGILVFVSVRVLSLERRESEAARVSTPAVPPPSRALTRSTSLRRLSSAATSSALPTVTTALTLDTVMTSSLGHLDHWIKRHVRPWWSNGVSFAAILALITLQVSFLHAIVMHRATDAMNVDLGALSSDLQRELCVSMLLPPYVSIVFGTLFPFGYAIHILGLFAVYLAAGVSIGVHHAVGLHCDGPDLFAGFRVLIAVFLMIALLEYVRERRRRRVFLVREAARYSFEQAERVLRQLLPEHVENRIKSHRSVHIEERHRDVVIAWADLVGFTKISSNMPPIEVLRHLDDLYTRFDRIAQAKKLWKMDTIGDAYVVIGGLFDARRTSDVLEDVFEATIAMRDEVAAFRDETDLDVKVRIGVHVGPVIEGILGVLRPRYHVFGLTVLDAAEAESSGKPGEIHLTKAAAEAYGLRKFDLQRDENEEVYLQADSVDAVIEEDPHFITELRHG